MSEDFSRHQAKTAKMHDIATELNTAPGQVKTADLSVCLPVDRYLEKLRLYPMNKSALIVDIANPLRLSGDERNKLITQISNTNYAFYQYQEANPAFRNGYRAICRQLGLIHSISNPAADRHHVTSIKVADSSAESVSRYIPFTDKALKWHTDGYYNAAPDIVRSFVLHCRQPAMQGGETCLLDPEVVYALLHTKNPLWTRALGLTDTMTIPANVYCDKEIRPQYAGPVFTCDPDTGHLHTRYTERSRNIHWREDPATSEALGAIREILNQPNHWITRHTLKAGQGVISNNALHCRTVFSDAGNASPRILERIRFRDRVSSTNET